MRVFPAATGRAGGADDRCGADRAAARGASASSRGGEERRGPGRALAALALSLLPVVALAQEPPFDAEATAACVARGGGEACIGLAAQACQARPDGQTTMGIAACLTREGAWWDDRLNAAYRALQDVDRTRDAENARPDMALPSAVEALRDMQRAWIGFRDASCHYAAARWGAGSIRMVEAAACHLDLTARQALALEGRLDAL